VSQPAPGQLGVVEAFVNSVDLDDATEELGSPEALVAWLAERGLVEDGARATKADLARAVALREALRELLLAHHGDYEPDPDAAPTIDATAARAKLRLAFDAGGVARPAPDAPGVDGALGRLLAIVAGAQADGTWTRMKACPADTCRWAFYDRSKNRSGVWCNMAVCGNRAKVRSYRERTGKP
jgi:predicted RNA-binding Zn ribbon-like protein